MVVKNKVEIWSQAGLGVNPDAMSWVSKPRLVLGLQV